MNFRALTLNVFLVALLVFSPSVFSKQSLFIDVFDGQFDASRYLSENAYGFLPVPIIITDPALEGGAGLVGIFFHETEEDKDQRLKAMQTSDAAAAHLLPPSASALAAAYTGNDSWFAGAGHMAFWDRGNIRYTGGAGHGDVNLAFYGFGDTALPKSVDLNTKASAVFQSVRFKLGDTPFFAGVHQRYIDANISPSNFSFLTGSTLPQDIKDRIKTVLTLDTKTSGLGLIAEFDTRDNFFSPKEGYYYTLEWIRFDESIGSDIDYNLAILEGLNYWRLADDWRMGLRLYSENANANGFLPPYATPALIQRGIPFGRYQGNHVQQAELEANYEINYRWELSAFIGAGRVANELDEMSDASNLYNRGAGFRYHVARRYGFFMGLDFARGPEDYVWYIQAGSAW
jgi:hypothetical protein